MDKKYKLSIIAEIITIMILVSIIIVKMNATKIVVDISATALVIFGMCVLIFHVAYSIINRNNDEEYY